MPGSGGEEEEVERHSIMCRGGDWRAWGRGSAPVFGREVAASQGGRRGRGIENGASSLREGGRGAGCRRRASQGRGAVREGRRPSKEEGERPVAGHTGQVEKGRRPGRYHCSG
jgi:hypothetical protein